MAYEVDSINEIYEELIGNINQLSADAPELLKKYDEIRKYIDDAYQKIEQIQAQMVDAAEKSAEKATKRIEKKQIDALTSID